MNRGYTCIICPNGCEITAEIEGTEVGRVDGALCKRGREYVVQELTDPRRNIASSVEVDGGELPLCSVRLDAPIPKKEIFAVMAEIRKVKLAAPVKIGQIVIENVCGLGSSVIATKNVAPSRCQKTKA